MSGSNGGAAPIFADAKAGAVVARPSATAEAARDAGSGVGGAAGARWEEAKASSKGAKERMVKVLMVGNSGTGKSCLLLRFCDDTFETSFFATIGIDFKVKRLRMNGHPLRVLVWDAAGQERFQTIVAAYYRGAHGVVFCYDVTDPDSFNNISYWLRQAKLNAPEQARGVLVANKCDLTAQRLVSAEQGRALAEQVQIPYFEVSAKTGANVDAAFKCLVHDIVGADMPPAPSGVALATLRGAAAAKPQPACACA
jgi:small GTP-binding protein